MSTSGLTSAILDFRLPLTSVGIRNSTIVFLDPENMGVAVEILFLCAIEAEIRCMYLFSKPMYNNFRFGGRHIGFPGGARVFLKVAVCSPVIFRKSHASVCENSERFGNSSIKIGLEGKFTPSPLSNRRVKALIRFYPNLTDDTET